MAKKSYTAFPAVNCQRIRNLQEIITKSEKQRDDAFAARDHALEQIHACGEAETEKQTRLKADHSDAACKLDGLAKTIKWARKELATTIEQADEENLFNNADVEVPDWDAEDKADEDDDRPIGEPETDRKPDASDDEQEPAEERFSPGKWELQEVGKRGRGPTLAFESVEAVYAEVDARIGSSVSFTVKVDGDNRACRTAP